MTIAPSIDIRNRYDTYGVGVNDAPIVLRITLGRGVAILTGDAGFDSWGKVCEEFPRVRHLIYPRDSRGALDLRDPTAADIAFLSQDNQLNCQLLKMAHHGSKRGTSYGYIEKLAPTHFVIPCDADSQYRVNWRHKFPHPITRLIVAEQRGLFAAHSSEIPDLAGLGSRTATTAANGTDIYTITRGAAVSRTDLGEAKADRVTACDLEAALP